MVLITLIRSPLCSISGCNFLKARGALWAWQCLFWARGGEEEDETRCIKHKQSWCKTHRPDTQAEPGHWCEQGLSGTERSHEGHEVSSCFRDTQRASGTKHGPNTRPVCSSQPLSALPEPDTPAKAKNNMGNNCTAIGKATLREMELSGRDSQECDSQPVNSIPSLSGNKGLLLSELCLGLLSALFKVLCLHLTQTNLSFMGIWFEKKEQNRPFKKI